jgi:tripeptidyl-peptidase-1
LGVDSQQYVNRTNVEFQKIGLRGVTLLASSGDSGANGRTDGGCTDTVLHPIFPGGSPYVTSVGATELSNPVFGLTSPPPACSSYPCASGGTEVAVSYDLSGFTSGGGFSTYATQPSYQTTAVNAYLKSGVALPPSSYYAAGGRAYPDIAALGHNFLVYLSGSIQQVGGTSASSPTIGGIISILNSYRLKNGQKQIGFANTFLYQMWEEHPLAFNDVLSGDNICTEDGCASTCQGFKAYKGWDPVTGLGSPNVAQMISYIGAKSNKVSMNI